MSAGDTLEQAGIALELPGGARALFTTRAEGNLSTLAGAGYEHGLERRERLCERLALRWLCASPQQHGTNVHTIDRVAASGGAPVQAGADAHVTALTRVGAMVLAADCLPVALSCEGTVASVHAGWRGLSAGVLERALEALRALAGPGAQARAIVGPAAGRCCYEVGEEVHAAFGGAHRHGRRIDLRAIAQQRLLDAGVQNVEHVERCTICDERFFSYRREGAQAGRQAVIAWLS